MSRIRIAFSALLVALVASSSSAVIITYDANYGPEAAAVAAHPVASLPLFDPGLGTLQKVTLELDAETSAGSIAWDNEAQITSDITLGIGAEVTVSAMSLLTAIAVPLQTDSAVAIDADNDGAADFIGTDAFSVVGGTGIDSDSDMSTLPATLAAFTGVGTFDAILSSAVETFLSTTGGFGPIDPVPGVTNGTVKVTYEYVPEPGTISLLLLGGSALFFRRRGR